MEIAENITHIQNEIDQAAAKNGYSPGNTCLLAVSKKQPPEKLQAALDAGHRTFGENRVQEADEHWSHHRSSYPDLKIHLIGPLQSNKSADALILFDAIHTIDREKIVKTLVKERKNLQDKARCQEFFIQVNTGAEDQKSGVFPSGLESLLSYAAEQGLDITGLMCIPPVDEPPALHFALLKKLAQRYDLPYLSMGMSGDYKKAVALGARYVRVGSAIFGDRIKYA